jgi:hypothetical protein
MPDGAATLQSAPAFGRYTVNSCLSWTSTSTSYAGTYVQPNGSIATGSGAVCTAVRPLACCNGAPKHVFAGFSASSYTGDIGGRPAAHAICNAEFAGAHLCHGAEYLRSVSASPIPAEGAWLDCSTDASGNAVIQGAPSYGRYTVNSCLSWTSASTSYAGTLVQANGSLAVGSGVCSVARRIACCY